MATLLRKKITESHIFAAGNNANHCLGFNDAHNRTKFELVKFWEEKNIISISGSDTHSLALSYEGKVYSWGNVKYLGYEQSQFDQSPSQNVIPSFDSDNEPVQTIPRCIASLSDKCITSVQAANSYSLCLSVSGEVFGFGKSADGECGIAQKLIPFPTKIPIPERVTQVSARGKHSLFLTRTNKVYSTGYNFHGQCALGFNNIKVTSPSLVGGPLVDKKVTLICTGEQHSIFCTSDLELYTAGYNTYGQLGLGDVQKRVLPTRVQAFDNVLIAEVAAGANFTAVLTAAGELYTFGDNSKGNLGQGDVQKRLVPSKVLAFQKDPIFTIGVGFNHVFALTMDGKLFSFGNNLFGQLGVPSIIGNASRSGNGNYIGPASPSPKQVKTVVSKFGKLTSLVGTHESTFIIVTANTFTQRSLWQMRANGQYIDIVVEFAKSAEVVKPEAK